MSEPVFLVLDSDGGFRAAERDPKRAAQIAAHESGNAPWAWMAGDPSGRYPRESNAPMTPARAFALTNLPRVSYREVLAMSSAEAEARLFPYFDEVRRLSGKGPVSWKDWTAPIKGLLGENTKLHKKDADSPPAVALGLSLLPEQSVFLGTSVGGADFSMRDDNDRVVSRMAPFVGPVRDIKTATFCAGASVHCKEACLVYSGNNESDQRNALVKMGRSKALLSEPVAFLRLLVDSLAKYSESDSPKLGGGRAEKFCRLNVFSDIPWEIMAPWLFRPDLFGARVGRRIRYYDYTKVPGRTPGPLYDLSFSYSGGSNSGRNCSRELRAGRRIVLVFVDPKNYQKAAPIKKRLEAEWKRRGRATHALLGYTRAGKPKREPLPAFDEAAKQEYLRQVPLPSVIQDPAILDGRPLEVRDGDVSDIRPFDPGGIVVGLRYKVPQFKGSSFAGAPERFVVRGEVVQTNQGPMFKLPETPLAVPGCGAPSEGAQRRHAALRARRMRV